MALPRAPPEASQTGSQVNAIGVSSIGDIMKTSGVMPIAIVGMACRFPGNATTPKGLWELCCEGRSAWSEIPKDRMNLDGFWHPDVSKVGCFNNRGGHFLKEDVGLFDAPFFKINATEAKTMDPQQRMLLECTYEALENAGIPLDKVVGEPVGVYVGSASSDYSQIVNSDGETVSTYTATGLAATMMANRISYFYDLRGPSFTLDTACSSSLMALHLACQSLRVGESKQAIVGGVHLVLSPDCMTSMSLLGLFSNDGRSYTYDHRGTGYGRGEGIATLVIKPLKDAIEAGDNIRAIIRNSGANQDGRTPGVTFPSQDAQIDLMRSVYRSAGLDVLDTGYVEAHGTGTNVGDPIEAGAIAKVFTVNRSSDDPLIVGSIKPNIGHTEATSGLASVIKTVFLLETGIIPPNINFEKPNERIPLKEWKLKVPTSLIPFPNKNVRRASVCNFGFGGANAHIILEAPSSAMTNKPRIHNEIINGWKSSSLSSDEQDQSGFSSDRSSRSSSSSESLVEMALFHSQTPLTKASTPATLSTENLLAKNLVHGPLLQMTPLTNVDQTGLTSHHFSNVSSTEPSHIYVLSAFEKATVDSQMKGLITYLKAQTEADEPTLMQNLAYTLAERRSLHNWRVAIPAASRQALTESLEMGIKPVRSLAPPKLGFIFTGQGAQWARMGLELMNDFPVFAFAIRAADRCLGELGAQWSLIDELSKDAESSIVSRAYISQPAVTAIQIALVDLLTSWNIYAVAASGNSSGEISAAYATGALSMESALAIAYHRGTVAWALENDNTGRKGAMLAVRASESEIKAVLPQVTSGQVDLACYLSPTLIVASGDESAIDELNDLLKAQELVTTKLHVKVAYHSRHMLAVEQEYLAALGEIEHRKSSKAQFWSSSRGQLVDTETIDSSYWADNLVGPVKLSETLQSLCFPTQKGQTETSIDALVEIGPHTSFESPIKQILQANGKRGSKVNYLYTLKRGKAGISTMLQLASNLFAMGYNVNLAAVNFPSGNPKKRVLNDLPPYPWKHDKRYWGEGRIGRIHRNPLFARHDILGTMSPSSSNTEHQWRVVLRIQEIPWLLDHKIEENAIYPFSGFMAMTIQAAYQRAVTRGMKITDSTRYNLREIFVARSLVFHDESSAEVICTIRPHKEGTQSSSDLWDEFTIASWGEEEGWQEHCRGLISVVQGEKELNAIDGVRHAQAESSALKQRIKDIDAACVNQRDCSTAYDSWAKGGLVFGPTYRNIHEARTGDWSSVVSLKIPDTAKCMPKSHESELIIHPATLDTIMQSTIYSLTLTDTNYSLDFLPVYMKSLSISHGINRKAGDALKVYCTSRVMKGPQGVGSVLDPTSNLVVLDPTSKNLTPLLEAVDYTGSAISRRADQKTEVEARNLCFKYRWDVHVDSLLPSQYEKVFPIVGAGQNAVQANSMFEQAAFYYAERVLEEILEDEAQLFPDHFQKLYGYLQHHFTAYQDNVTLAGQRWVDFEPSEKEDLLSKVAACGEMGEIINKFGEYLASVMRQEVEPLAVLLEENLLERFYTQEVGLLRTYSRVATYIDKVAHTNPNLRILELGAGFGGATIPILEILGGKGNKPPRFLQYDCTDMAAGFFEKAEEKLKDWGELVSFKEFDINMDAESQGYAPQSYDVIIAGDVMHMSPHLGKALRNVKSLLKEGGKLVMTEPTSTRLTDYTTFATLQGWWECEDYDRTESPFLSEEQWNSVLKENGFSGLDAGIASKTEGSEYDLTVMFSTREVEQEITYPEAMIVFDKEPSNALLVDKLKASLDRISGKLAVATTLDRANVKDKFLILLDLEQLILPSLTEEQFALLQKTFAAAKGILWVVRGAFLGSTNPDANMALGLARTMRSENAAIKFVTLDLDDRIESDEASAATIVRIFKTTFGSNTAATDIDVEFAERGNIIQIPRIVPDAEADTFVMCETQMPTPEMQPFIQKCRNLRLKMKTPGLLDTLYFTEDDRTLEPLGDNDVEVEVKAVGMNFKDVMIGMGQIPYEDLGFECGGVVVAVGSLVTEFAIGDRVCTMTSGCYANRVRAKDFTVQHIPDDMSFSVAASVLIIFTTAHYSLVDVARLSPGESILIHAAAGGVGQSATMIAQKLGAEVFITVGSVEKKEFMMSTFGIPEDHIFSSRDVTFEKGIMRMTKGQGVDVILNSTASESLRMTWNCLAPLGRFIEIGKKDLVQNSRLEMRKFLTMATFASVDLGVIIARRPQVFKKICSDVMALLRTGAVKPVIPIATFPMSDIEVALRLMQKGKHMGKIVIEVVEGDQVRAIPAPIRMNVARADASYLITGGTGGLGRSTARWLVFHGAKNIILASRSGSSSQKVKDLVVELGNYGAKISVYKCDVAEKNQLKALIEESAAEGMPPIRGVIHGVMVLRDMVFEMSTHSDWHAVVAPKVQGCWNLHNLLPRSLDFFIMLSSISGIVGNRGQAAYAASSTFLDAFAHYRTSTLGLSATSIDLGVVADVGYVAENKDRQAQITANAGDQVRELEYLALLKAAICQEPPNICGTGHHCQTITGCKLPSGPASKSAWFATDPIWSHLIRIATSSTSSPHDPLSSSSEPTISISKALRTCTTLSSAQTLVRNSLIQKLSTILSVPVEDFEPSKPMIAYGLDSLVAIEVRNWLAREMEASVPMLKLLGGQGLGVVSKEIVKLSKCIDSALLGEVEGEGEGEGGSKEGRE